MTVAGVLSGFFVVWAAIGLGYVVGRTGVLGTDAHQVLSRLAFYVGSALGVLCAATHVSPPELVVQPVQIVAGAAVPATLLAFGISLVRARPLPAPGARTDTLLAAGAKVVLHPPLTYGLARALGLEGHGLYAAVVMGSLSTAQNLYVAAVRYDRAHRVPGHRAAHHGGLHAEHGGGRGPPLLSPEQRVTHRT